MKKKTVLLATIHLLLCYASFSQKKDSVFHLSGTATVTNNGISIVPSFSLEKAAAIFMLSAGKGRLSIDPDIRFSLAGKPWSMLFWGRYKVATGKTFQMNVGAHLGLNYKTSLLPINGDTGMATVARRYLAGEIFPRVTVAKNVSIGIYYLYSHGLDAGTIGNTDFVTFNANFSYIKIARGFFAKFNPQVYYLKLDNEDGFYYTSALTLAKNNFPLSVSSIVNKKINSNISNSKDLVWNVGLVYSFNKAYVSKKVVL